MTEPNAGSTAVILDKAVPWLMKNNETFRDHIETRLLELLFAEKESGGPSQKPPLKQPKNPFE